MAGDCPPLRRGDCPLARQPNCPPLERLLYAVLELRGDAGEEPRVSSYALHRSPEVETVAEQYLHGGFPGGCAAQAVLLRPLADRMSGVRECNVGVGAAPPDAPPWVGVGDFPQVRDRRLRVCFPLLVRGVPVIVRCRPRRRPPSGKVPP